MNLSKSKYSLIGSLVAVSAGLCLYFLFIGTDATSETEGTRSPHEEYVRAPADVHTDLQRSTSSERHKLRVLFPKLPVTPHADEFTIYQSVYGDSESNAAIDEISRASVSSFKQAGRKGIGAVLDALESAGLEPPSKYSVTIWDVALRNALYSGKESALSSVITNNWEKLNWKPIAADLELVSDSKLLVGGIDISRAIAVEWTTERLVPAEVRSRLPEPVLYSAVAYGKANETLLNLEASHVILIFDASRVSSSHVYLHYDIFKAAPGVQIGRFSLPYRGMYVYVTPLLAAGAQVVVSGKLDADDKVRKRHLKVSEPPGITLYSLYDLLEVTEDESPPVPSDSDKGEDGVEKTDVTFSLVLPDDLKGLRKTFQFTVSHRYRIANAEEFSYVRVPIKLSEMAPDQSIRLPIGREISVFTNGRDGYWLHRMKLGPKEIRSKRVSVKDGMGTIYLVVVPVREIKGEVVGAAAGAKGLIVESVMARDLPEGWDVPRFVCDAGSRDKIGVVCRRISELGSNEFHTYVTSYVESPRNQQPGIGVFVRAKDKDTGKISDWMRVDELTDHVAIELRDPAHIVRVKLSEESKGHLDAESFGIANALWKGNGRGRAWALAAKDAVGSFVVVEHPVDTIFSLKIKISVKRNTGELVHSSRRIMATDLQKYLDGEFVEFDVE